MGQKIAKDAISNLLKLAGVNINGNNPWDIKVKNDAFYEKVLTNGSIGIGEAYLQQLWDCTNLDEFFSRVLRTSLENKIKRNWKLLAEIFFTKVFNYQTRARAIHSVQKHYDLDNHLFQCMLDKRMLYTCAYWKNAATLDEAQEKKLETCCHKLYLKSGMHILDVGCGWGGFAKFAAENYGVKVTGITVSEEQMNLASQICKGLPIDIKLMDYRDVDGNFDRVVSLGMFEHVGVKNYRTYMKVIQQCLKDDGLFLLHTIGGNSSGTYTDPWIDKYIFPGSVLPSIKQIGNAIEGLFVMEDWQNFGADYDKTLMAWHDNFVKHWDELKNDYDERFYRLWTYYLLMCAGSFRARKNQLWQIVLSKNGVPNGYLAIR